MARVVISLGGSLIYPDMLDKAFLGAFRDLVLDYVERGQEFIIICGGGRIAREYQETATFLARPSHAQQDWLGIAATKMNALLVHTLFPEQLVHPAIVDDPSIPLSVSSPIVICSGWKPGWSTDYDAVLLAKQLGADRVVNMSNIEHVYDRNPLKHADAKPYTKMSWTEFRKLVGDDWKPGMSAPFDPIAAQQAQLGSISVVVMGKDLTNLRKFLDGKEFVGTTIED